MRVVYVCDSCEEIVEEMELNEDLHQIHSDCLTAEEGHDIMKMANGSIYFSTICDECLLELANEKDFSFLSAPVIN